MLTHHCGRLCIDKVHIKILYVVISLVRVDLGQIIIFIFHHQRPPIEWCKIEIIVHVCK